MKYFFLLLIFSTTLSAQFYEEPNSSNFKFSVQNIDARKEIAAELTQYLLSLNPKEFSFQHAEKVLAFARHMDPENKKALILNASIKHKLPIEDGPAYSKETLLKKANEFIFFLNEPKDKNKMTAALFLNDIISDLTGKNNFPQINEQGDKLGIKVDWAGIIHNYKKENGTTITSSVLSSGTKLGVINKIKHPEFKNKPKPLHNRQATINGLMVTTNAQGVNAGISSEVIGTVSPSKGKTSFAFKRKVGASMVQSLIDAEKALKIRFPQLEDGHKVDISFSNKFVDKDGDSAGTAITVMLFSLFEGLQIDQSVAITGTISPNWKVGIVGGVASKIRGALKANRKIVGIPVDNSSAVQDLVILYGIDNILKTQVFSLQTLEQAIDLARVDKSERLTKALALFKSTAKRIPRDMRFSNDNDRKKIIASLINVLKLCPNHLSARTLYNVMSGKRFIRLSFITSVEEVGRLSSSILSDPKIPDKTVKETLKSLARYTRRVDNRVAPFAKQIDTFLSSYLKYKGMAETLKAKLDRGIRDMKLYENFKTQEIDVKLQRSKLTKFAKQIDKDIQSYFEKMRNR